MPTAFVPHGGGPWPVLALAPLDEGERSSLAAYMGAIGKGLPERPQALLVVSAHWEEEAFTVNFNAAPGMLYDYRGFPDEAYSLMWPAPGAPGLAERVHGLIHEAGLPAARERTRGHDHGVFIPLMLAYPKAEVPVVHVSLMRSLDPAAHYALGAALAPLRDEGIFIIGSGNSYHNLNEIFRPTREARAESQIFDRWVNDVITGDPDDRRAALVDWASAPLAQRCHPREEHLIPLMVAAGAADGEEGVVAWKGRMNGFAISAHRFGA